MATTLIKSKGRKRGIDPDQFNTMQRAFCWEMQACELRNPTESARRAGYAIPGVAAAKLMKLPKIQAFLGKLQRERENRTKLTSDRIWAYLGRVLFYNPLGLFESDGSGWFITDIGSIPEEVGQMIEEIETIPDPEGGQPKLRLRLVSKAKALEVAARHALTQRISLEQRPALDYDELLQKTDVKTIDAVSKRIEQESMGPGGND